MLGRLEQYWDCPDEFRPERWFGENGGKTINQKAFIPFSVGPRVCKYQEKYLKILRNFFEKGLGKDMAYIEAKIMVVMVMQRFRLELVNKDQDLKIAPAATLKIDNGLFMFVRKI